ncbi:hypothetical protein [Paenisporosarcina indica]|nr:hypothetical protein [Paenisporosarcina indica]
MKKTVLLAIIISFSSLASVNFESEKINLVVVNYELPQDTVPIHPPV